MHTFNNQMSADFCTQKKVVPSYNYDPAKMCAKNTPIFRIE